MLTLIPGAAAASPSRVAVLVVAPFDPSVYAGRGAVGLMVPGAGATVSRRGALAALERGKVQSALLGGVPKGEPLIHVAQQPGAITIYVSLPPPGKHDNDRRYPIAVVGGGYRGILTSSETRIRGLVSVADVAPTALALQAGEKPRIRSSADDDPPADLRSLDRRLSDTRDLRPWAIAILVAATILLLPWGRAAILVPVATITAALILSAAGATSGWVVLPVLAVAAFVGSPAAARAGPLVTVGFLVAFLTVMAAWPEVNSLAVIGPHPWAGGRFYGLTNEVETVLLAPVLAAGAAFGVLPVAVLALVTVGWSDAGADGGGLLVFAAGFAVLAIRRRTLTPARVAVAAAAAVVLVLGLIGLDAAAGGSSHVTRAVGDGPGALLGDLGHRIHVSWAAATSSWHALLLTLVCVTVLALIACNRPRPAAVDALLVALAVSLLVNDSPTTVASFGLLGAAALLRHERATKLE